MNKKQNWTWEVVVGALIAETVNARESWSPGAGELLFDLAHHAAARNWKWSMPIVVHADILGVCVGGSQREDRAPYKVRSAFDEDIVWNVRLIGESEEIEPSYHSVNSVLSHDCLGGQQNSHAPLYVHPLLGRGKRICNDDRGDQRKVHRCIPGSRHGAHPGDGEICNSSTKKQDI